MNPPRILVVEDEAIVAKDLENTLTRLGYEVTGTVRAAEDALEHARRDPPPDLVLMDINLAGRMDGIEAAQRLHESHPVPVIFLTAFLDEDTIARAKATNPYGYLIKPFNERELHSSVEVALARLRAERRMRQSEARFSSTLRSMADGVIATDLAGTVTYLNPVAEQLTGWPTRDAVGRSLAEVFNIHLPSGEKADPLPLAPDPDPVEPGVAVANGGRAIVLSTRGAELIPVEDNTAPIMDEEGSLAGLVVVFRRRPESRPSADADPSWANLVGIVEGIGDPLFALDGHWTLTYANRQAANYFGKRREDLIGHNFWDQIPRSVQTRYRPEFFAALLQQEARTFELHHESRSLWFETHAYPFGEGLLVLFRDITGRKAAEEQRAKMEKLESLGLLARGFAHDFNNLLTVLLGNLSLATMRLGDGDPAKSEIETAKGATLQAQNLVQQLLTFAKGGAPVKKLTLVGQLVTDTLRENQRRDDVEYEVVVADAVPPAEIDPDQIKRLVINLVRNAEDAARPGGTISVRCHPALTHPENDDGPAVAIEVHDNGHGVSGDDLPFVFEPYFSTRGDANATGIGLTVCESIAKAHEGTIALRSEAGKGTRVTVTLPASAVHPTAPAPGAAAGPRRAPAARAEPKRILILEDEPLVRQLAVTHLSRAGFKVTTTTDGTDTVERYRESRHNGGGPFDLLILDLTIPNGMGGARAMEQIMQIDPDVLAVVSSGYSDDPVMAHPKDYGFRAVLRKPYEPSELTELVSTLLR